MSATDGPRVRLQDVVRIERAGYHLERWGDRGWVLRDLDGDALLIGGHGCTAPRKADAVAEALQRIEDDERSDAEHAKAEREWNRDLPRGGHVTASSPLPRRNVALSETRTAVADARAAIKRDEAHSPQLTRPPTVDVRDALRALVQAVEALADAVAAAVPTEEQDRG